MKRPDKAKKRLLNFDFNTEGAHVALVDAAANGHSVLITKSLEQVTKEFKDAKVEMPLQEFLDAFFSQPEDIQEEQYFTFENRANGKVPVTNEPYLEDRINHFDFMKSLHESKDFDSITDEQEILLKMFQLEVEKTLLTGDVDDSKQDSVTSPVDGEIPNEKDEILKGDKMSEDKNVDVQEILKQLESQGEMLKSIKAENDALKAEKEAKYEQELIEKAKGFSFVGEEQAESVGKLFKSLDAENLVIMLEVFKAAQDKIEAKDIEEENADMFVQKSASGESDVELDDRVALVNKALNISK